MSAPPLLGLYLIKIMTDVIRISMGKLQLDCGVRMRYARLCWSGDKCKPASGEKVHCSHPTCHTPCLVGVKPLLLIHSRYFSDGCAALMNRAPMSVLSAPALESVFVLSSNFKCKPCLQLTHIANCVNIFFGHTVGVAVARAG